MWPLLLNLAGPVIGKVLGGVLKGKVHHESVIDEAVRGVTNALKSDEQLRRESERIALEHAKTLLKYEGEASDLPLSARWFRSLVRPGIALSGWAVFLLTWIKGLPPPPDFIQTAWIGFSGYWFISRAREKGMKW